MDKPESLREAAQAVVDRWDSPKWKDEPHTAVFIDRLRAALSSPAHGDGKPVAASFDALAKAMAEMSGWDKWDATNYLDTLGGNDPDEEREYWRDLARLAIQYQQAVDLSSLERHDPYLESGCDTGTAVTMEQANKGEWVRFADVQKLFAQAGK